MNLKIKNKYIKKYRSGYPAIIKEYIETDFDVQEGEIVNLVDDKNNFIAKGYLCKQNKAIGWILSYNAFENIDYDFFYNKISDAINYRKKVINLNTTNGFRVFNGEGDKIGGLIIDYYNGYYVISFYSLGIFKYSDYIIDVIKSISGIKGIYQKKRFAEGGKYIDEDEFVYGTRAEFPIIIKENNVKYAIYLNSGAMVGIFTDQRDVRSILKNKYSKNKLVLNTFSYTGAFSVVAALGNAKRTVSVDLAKRSLSLTKEQFQINDINLSNNDIVIMDVFEYFKYAKRKNLKYDVVILDPPSFATSKKKKFRAEKNYVDLLKDAIDITNNSGVIIASTNCAKFNMFKFKEFIQEAFFEKNIKYEIDNEFRLPIDYKTLKEYKEGNYLKVVFIKLNNK